MMVEHEIVSGSQKFHGKEPVIIVIMHEYVHNIKLLQFNRLQSLLLLNYVFVRFLKKTFL